MTQYIAAQRSPITQLADLNSAGFPPDPGYADAEAGYAATNGLGFGTNGLQVSDIANYAAGKGCTSDWCAMFDLYFNATGANGKPITLSLQTLLASDPTNAQATGSLAQLLPFVKTRHATNLELYVTDLLLAFDPNYVNTVGANANYAPYAASYAAAIAAYRN